MIDKIKKGIRYLTDPDYRFMINAEAGRYDGMPDEEYLKRLYRSLNGRELNLENPTRINEKVQRDRRRSILTCFPTVLC